MSVWTRFKRKYMSNTKSIEAIELDAQVSNMIMGGLKEMLNTKSTVTSVQIPGTVNCKNRANAMLFH